MPGRRWPVQLAVWTTLLTACGDAVTPPVDDEGVVSLAAVSTRSQEGPVAAAVNYLPVVVARLADSTPAAGVVVTFQGADLGTAPIQVTTDAAGLARLPSWTLPAAPGRSVVEARHEALPPVSFEAHARARAFNLELRLLAGDPGPVGQAAMDAAEQLIESIIFGDLPDVTLASFQPSCSFGGPPNPVLNETVDDLLVLVRVRNVDGPGGAGALGTPCALRDPGAQPIVALIELDSVDFLTAGPSTTDFILHELIHALGMVTGVMNRTLPSGFTRQCANLLSTPAPNALVQDSHFSCANARAAFDRVGGAAYTARKVPLENGAAFPATAGTLNNHWRETTFGLELMSAFYQGAPAPLSQVTIGLLEDLGYRVSYAPAHPFQLTPPIATTRARAAGRAPRLHDAWPGDPPIITTIPVNR